jgi:protein-L-isoaspartate(D-aspartate) O-methyltransferase
MAALASALLAAACTRRAPTDAERFLQEREAMTALIAAYSPEQRVRAPRVLAAMRKVPRHEFVPAGLRRLAYADSPLEIGEGQTISQPLIVGCMTEALAIRPGDKVLEIGTGSGYQAAILAELAGEVYTVEILEALSARAAATLAKLGYHNIHARAGDGYRGWPEAAPFDAIIVTCAPERIPQPLIDQLKDGGRMVIPIGRSGIWNNQELLLLRKTAAGLTQEKRMAVRFVPMTGQAQRRP